MVHQTGCIGLMEAGRRNQHSGGDTQVELAAAAAAAVGLVADIPAAGCSCSVEPGNLVVVGHMLLSGSNCSDCNWMAGCWHCN